MAVIVNNDKTFDVDNSFEEAQRVFGPMLDDAPKFIKDKYASQVKSVRDRLCELTTVNSNKETCGDKRKTIYVISKANVTVDNTGCIRNIISNIHGDAYNTIEYAGDEIIKTWRNFDDHLKRHPEIWQSLADKLWNGFVDYKDIPFGNKEIWHEQKN